MDELKTVTRYNTEALFDTLRKAKEDADLTNAGIATEGMIRYGTAYIPEALRYVTETAERFWV